MVKTPNFFIAGAAKAGTTSIHHYLGQHPEIYFSPLKEPNFFSTDIKVENFTKSYKKRSVFVDEKYFKYRPLEELQLSFIRDESQYKLLFDQVKKEKVIGEASTSYLFSKKAARNIFDFNPKAKILIVLRNPVERTFSHYLMALRYGFTTSSLQEAVRKDQRKHKKGWGQSELFIELGLYFEQLRRYFDTFPSHQIKIILFEDLVLDAEKTMSDIYEFLGVESTKTIDLAARNQAEIPRSSRLNKFMADSGIKQIAGKALNKNLKEKIKPVLFSKDKSKVRFTRRDKQFLLSFFQEDINKTSRLIGKDLSKWLKI